MKKRHLILFAVVFYQSLLFASGESGWVIAWGGSGSGIARTFFTNNYAVGTVVVNGKEVSNIVSIAAGSAHGLALKNDGTVIGWGWNYYGQTTIPDGLSNVVSIAAGENYSMALERNGTVVMWGQDGDLRKKSFNGATNITAISAGWRSPIALKNDGTVGGLSECFSGLSNIVAVAAPMSDHGNLVALKSDNTVVESTLQPNADQFSLNASNIVAINASMLLDKQGVLTERWYGNKQGSAILSNVAAFSEFGNSAGEYKMALKNDGTVVGWGRGRYFPRKTPDGLSGVIAVAVGGDFCLAITTNRAVAEQFMNK